MLIQLSPSIPLDTPKGPGLAILVNELSEEHHLLWTVIIDSTGEIWTFENPQVRGTKNVTFGRTTNSQINTNPSKGPVIVSVDAQSPLSTKDDNNSTGFLCESCGEDNCGQCPLQVGRYDNIQAGGSAYGSYSGPYLWDSLFGRIDFEKKD